MIKSLLTLAAILLAANVASAETVRFKASDGIIVTADFQKPEKA